MTLMDVHGGKGIMLGPNNYLGTCYQGAPIALPLKVANILTRNIDDLLAKAASVSSFVFKRSFLPANNPEWKGSLVQFDKALFAHIGFAIANFFFVALGFSLRGLVCCSSIYGWNQSNITVQCSVTRSNMAFLSDVAMGVLGGEVKTSWTHFGSNWGGLASYLILGSWVCLNALRRSRRPEICFCPLGRMQ